MSSVKVFFRCVCILATNAYQLYAVSLSAFPSVRPAYISSAPTGRIFLKFDIEHFHYNVSRRCTFV